MWKLYVIIPENILINSIMLAVRNFRETRFVLTRCKYQSGRKQTSTSNGHLGEVHNKILQSVLYCKGTWITHELGAYSYHISVMSTWYGTKMCFVLTFLQTYMKMETFCSVTATSWDLDINKQITQFLNNQMSLVSTPIIKKVTM